MLHHRGKARQPRSGVVVLFVAVCLVALLGVAAISLDGGQIVSERERAQATADAAALAAASDLYYNYLVNNGLDMQGSATASALSTAAANGYTNDGTNSVITPNALDVTTGNTEATCTGVPLLTVSVVTTAVKISATVGLVENVTVSAVAVAAETLPTAPSLKTTVLLGANGLKLEPLMVICVASIGRPSVL